MASEPNHHVGYSRENECWFVRFYPYQTEQQAKDAAAAFARPAPAATDTGLVTIGGINLASGEMISCQDFDDGNPLHIPCCRKDRAEELLAAKEAKTEALARMLRISESRADNLTKRLTTLEAKLAAAEKVREAAIELDEAVSDDFNIFGAQQKLRAVLGGKP
ncbi:hypothetical protein I2750_19880 [Bacillus sp. PR5]|nr:hypothetical protein [Bacillus sp. PR5]